MEGPSLLSNNPRTMKNFAMIALTTAGTVKTSASSRTTHGGDLDLQFSMAINPVNTRFWKSTTPYPRSTIPGSTSSLIEMVKTLTLKSETHHQPHHKIRKKNSIRVRSIPIHIHKQPLRRQPHLSQQRRRELALRAWIKIRRSLPSLDHQFIDVLSDPGRFKTR